MIKPFNKTQIAILQDMIDGKHRKLIAYEKGVSYEAIRDRLTKMRDRLQVENNFQLIAYAVQNGLITFKQTKHEKENHQKEAGTL